MKNLRHPQEQQLSTMYRTNQRGSLSAVAVVVNAIHPQYAGSKMLPVMHVEKWGTLNLFVAPEDWRPQLKVINK